VILWWLPPIAAFALLVRRDIRLARKHREAIEQLPACPVFPIEMARRRRTNLHIPPPRGVGQNRRVGGSDASLTCGRPEAWEATPVGPRGDDAA
jgi:hypothetical protein